MHEQGTPVSAGVVAAVVGFSSSFVVVLAGLTAVGATPDQAASGLLALCVAQALGMLWLALRHRTPVSLAWSTPGAALLVTTGAVQGGWPAAVGPASCCRCASSPSSRWPTPRPWSRRSC